MRARLLAFHSDCEAQILPLVLAFGLVFFTGVVLVINTGHTVNDRIASQNAIDSSIVTGANTIARGMNYVCRNNVSEAKLIASIVIVRAIPPSAKMALKVLKGWDAAAKGMKAAGQALQGSAFPPTVIAGTVMVITAAVLKGKVLQERVILKIIDKISTKLKKIWAPDGDTNKKKGGWQLIRALNALSDIVVRATPVLAQVSARTAYRVNMPGSNLADLTTPGALMIPLYPNLPVCKGRFGDFVDPTTHYTKTLAKPIKVFGLAVLTLSMFTPILEGFLTKELYMVFKTPDMPDPEDPTEPKPEGMERLEEIKRDNNADANTIELREIEREVLRWELGREPPETPAEAKADRDRAQKRIDERKKDQPDPPVEGEEVMKGPDESKVAAWQARLDTTDETHRGVDDTGASKRSLRTKEKEAFDAAKAAAYADLESAHKKDGAWEEPWNEADAQTAAEEEAAKAPEVVEAKNKREKHEARIAAIGPKNADPDDTEIGVLQATIKGRNDEAQQILKDHGLPQTDPDSETVPPDDELAPGEPGEGDPNTSPPAIEKPPAGAKGNKKPKEIYPYLMNLHQYGKGGKGEKHTPTTWRQTITYFGFGWRKVREPRLQGENLAFGDDETPLFSYFMKIGVVYASAEIYNEEACDLWTPGWKAQLVRASIMRLPPSPLGNLTPPECGANTSPTPPSGGSQTSDNAKTESGWREYADTVLKFLGKH